MRYNRHIKQGENIFYVWCSFCLRLFKGFEPIKPYSIGESLKSKNKRRNRKMKQYINGIEVKSISNKKYADMLEAYRDAVANYGYRTVHSCYRKPSDAKDDAEKKIWLEMRERNGYGYTVTRYISTTFSCAYLFSHPEDGKKILCYETPYHTYYIDAAGL